MLAADDFADRLVPYLTAAGVLSDPPSAEEREMLAAAAPLVQERMNLLGEAPGLLGFLFVSSDALVLEDDAVGSLPAQAGEVLAASIAALELIPQSEWATAAIEAALRNALVEELGLKPRVAFGPLRVAVSGRRVSPPLFESMELLGKEESVRRLERLAAERAS